MRRAGDLERCWRAAALQRERDFSRQAVPAASQPACFAPVLAVGGADGGFPRTTGVLGTCRDAHSSLDSPVPALHQVSRLQSGSSVSFCSLSFLPSPVSVVFANKLI